MPAASASAAGAEQAAPLVARLEAAEDAGAVDARQLADLLGVTAGALRAALARPHALSGEQAAAVARALAVDPATMRALRRAPVDDDARAAAAAPDGSARGPDAAASETPASTPELLECVLRAVRADAIGVALRAAVLDVCEGAARQAGRPLPPGAHALRARLASPDAVEPPAAAVALPLTGGAGDAAADAAARLARAAEVVRELQRTAPGYDDLFAPLHDDALADLLARHALAVHLAPGVPAGTRFVLTPPLLGRRRLVLSAGATADQRRLAVRTALAHCAAGDGGVIPSPAPEAAAGVADAAALADLVPFWQVADLRRRGRMGWRAIAAEVARAARAIAGDWPEWRAAARAELRTALFRHHGL
jgi:hypothetical protein